jgi:hypothetical protein
MYLRNGWMDRVCVCECVCEYDLSRHRTCQQRVGEKREEREEERTVKIVAVRP